jgi:hypothetical protein
VATIGGVHICSPPTVYSRDDEVAPLWTCSCRRRFLLEHFYTDDGRWLGASFDLSPDSEAFEPFVPQIKMGRRMPPETKDLLLRTLASRPS